MRYRKLRPQVILIACLLCVWTGCENFLEPDPASFTSGEHYYQSPEHFESAINSAYSRLRAQAGISTNQFRTLTEQRMDAINNDPEKLSGIPSQKPLREWYATPSNDWIYEQWSDAYHTIAQTNVILGRIEDVEFEAYPQYEAGDKERIVGQAKFIRALSYWYLVQFFGDVPLILEEVRTPSEAIPQEGRRPVEEVYQQIINDLQDAIAKLPESWSEPGRATEGAAKFLLGRTYLLMEDYSSAVAELEDVVQSYGYRLLSDYRDVFDPSNTNNAESIFELQFGADVAGQPHMGLIDDLLPWFSRGEIVAGNVNPSATYLPSLEFIERYEEGDLRKEASILWWEREEGSTAVLKKYLWPEHINAQGEQAGNDILFRYADALLSLAEAHWRLGNDEEAISYVDQVRDRAGLAGVDLTNVSENPLLAGTYLEDDPLGRAIFNERTVELAAEGHRMFDLVRFGVAFEVVSAYTESRKERDPRLQGSYNVEPHEILLPIPSQEINESEGAITQNPGW